MDFSWITHYWPLLLKGAEQTIALLVISVSLGFCLAVVLALLQVMGPKPLAKFSSGYCTLLRGTPLLVQLWLLYYGIGSLLPMIPGIRHSFMWPVLREGFFFAAVAFTLNYAAYEAVVLRSALLSVPKGEIEAGKAAAAMGLVGISEGAIPFAAQDPLAVIPANMLGSIVAAVMAFVFGVTNAVAHGGPIVALLGAMNKPLLALAAMAAGAVLKNPLMIYK